MTQTPDRTDSAMARPGTPESSDFTKGNRAPIRINTTGTPLDEGPRVPLFYVDGPDGSREYTIPERIPAAWSIQALKISATQGADAARWFLVEKGLTPEAVRELTEGEASRHVTREDVRDIFTELGDRFYGQAQEDTAGK